MKGNFSILTNNSKSVLASFECDRVKQVEEGEEEEQGVNYLSNDLVFVIFSFCFFLVGLALMFVTE